MHLQLVDEGGLVLDEIEAHPAVRTVKQAAEVYLEVKPPPQTIRVEAGIPSKLAFGNLGERPAAEGKE